MKTGRANRIRSFLLFSFICVSVTALPTTVLVSRREKLCFYQHVKKASKYAVKVFVFQGAGNIVLTVNGLSSGKKLNFYEQIHKSSTDHEYQFDAQAEETYEVCLSNDRQAQKHVMLEIVEAGVQEDQTEYNDPSEKDLGLDRVNELVNDLKKALKEIKDLQRKERTSLAWRETAAEENNTSMVRSSIMETVVLLVVSVGQIFFVRRWFQGKGTLLKHWR